MNRNESGGARERVHETQAGAISHQSESARNICVNGVNFGFVRFLLRHSQFGFVDAL